MEERICKWLDEFAKRIKERIDSNTDVRDIDEGTLFDWEIDDILERLKKELMPETSLAKKKGCGKRFQGRNTLEWNTCGKEDEGLCDECKKLAKGEPKEGRQNDEKHRR